MEKFMKKEDAVTYYSVDGLKDTACCLCGEKSPEYEFRGLGVCTHCLDYIRAKG
jgi:hypothetical protein